MRSAVASSAENLAEVCRKYGVRRLCVFGSAVREN
jgi:predicted nucleotidyltransferase